MVITQIAFIRDAYLIVLTKPTYFSHLNTDVLFPIAPEEIIWKYNNRFLTLIDMSYESK